MYTIVAKAEEVSQVMKSVNDYSLQVYPFEFVEFCIFSIIYFLNGFYSKEIKRLVDLFETYL